MKLGIIVPCCGTRGNNKKHVKKKQLVIQLVWVYPHFYSFRSTLSSFFSRQNCELVHFTIHLNHVGVSTPLK